MNKITNEEEYLKALQELEKLQVSKKPDTEKKLDELYDIIEEWGKNLKFEDLEKNSKHKEMTKLEALQEELDQYSEEEVKVFSVMAMKLLEYRKKKDNGEDVKPPKFVPELYDDMRDWARLRAEIHTEEMKNKK